MVNFVVVKNLWYCVINFCVGVIWLFLEGVGMCCWDVVRDFVLYYDDVVISGGWRLVLCVVY